MSEPTLDVPGQAAPESRYFDPDDRCAHPERWTSTDGDSTEVEVSALVAGLVRGIQPDYVLETGAAFGQTTCAIAAALRVNGHGQVVALETEPTRAFYARGRIYAEGLEEYAHVVEANSLEWTPEPFLIDLLFSDSNYEHRVPEFMHLRDALRPGAVVVFHDTAPARGAHRIPSGRSLREEIEAELVAPGLLSAVDLPTPRGVTICSVLA